MIHESIDGKENGEMILTRNERKHSIFRLQIHSATCYYQRPSGYGGWLSSDHCNSYVFLILFTFLLEVKHVEYQNVCFFFS